jgi:hypothetical protein
MRLVILFALSLSIITVTNAQCLRDSFFQIDSIGTHKEKLSIPLFVAFQSDSLLISINKELNNQLMSFKLLSKTKCQWNDNFSEGINSYQAILLDSPKDTALVTINLIYKDARNRFIEILYENDEERVLTIEEVLR